jgi:predicted transcriptional regulator
MARRKRGRLEIVMDVLEALDGAPQPPTRVATAANLPYDRLQPILEELAEKGLVELKPSPEGRGRVAALTERGRRLLYEMRRLRKLLEDFGLDIA